MKDMKLTQVPGMKYIRPYGENKFSIPPTNNTELNHLG